MYFKKEASQIHNWKSVSDPLNCTCEDGVEYYCRSRTSFATNNMRRYPYAALISSVMRNSPETLIQFYTQTDTEMQKELIDNYVKLKGLYHGIYQIILKTLRNLYYVNKKRIPETRKPS